MPWVWIESINDTEEDKVKIMLIQNMIASVDAGYKGDVNDFKNTIGYFRSIITTKKVVDDLTKTAVQNVIAEK